ncbi:hypothetical protein A6R68_21115 [Neotoma lepida]|uniref:Uncharacterized protein n=1 Tax=Neotoma lepida TaxID=56216 RepID=A0A1A6HRP5_NEOLE|nr:hypothetical protein A6R68_21115 [Neotoma lepida]
MGLGHKPFLPSSSENGGPAGVGSDSPGVYSIYHFVKSVKCVGPTQPADSVCPTKPQKDGVTFPDSEGAKTWEGDVGEDWAKIDEEHKGSIETHTEKVKTKVKVTPSAPPMPYALKGTGPPPYAPEIGDGKPSPKGQRDGDPTYAEAYAMKAEKKGKPVTGPWEQMLTPQMFPINLAPGPNWPQKWYPWGAKDLKELHKAVAEDRANSPWAQTLLQDIAYNPCVPKDWMDLAKAILSSTQFIKWTAHYKEECRVRVEDNRAAQPAIPITCGLQQAVVQGLYRDQVRQAGLEAWAKLDEGPTESPIRQQPSETLPKFIDRVQQSLNRKLPAGPLRDQFTKIPKTKMPEVTLFLPWPDAKDAKKQTRQLKNYNYLYYQLQYNQHLQKPT